MKNKVNIKRIYGLASAALAQIGQGYSPSRRQITIEQNKGGVLNSAAKNLQVNFTT